MGENGDGDTDEDHLVENNGEGVANAATGAMKHKRKGLVVTGKEGKKETKNIQLFSIQYSNFNSLPTIRPLDLVAENIAKKK